MLMITNRSHIFTSTMIDYLFRKPKFPLICNIDGLLIAANSTAMFQRRIDRVTLLPDKRYNAVDVTGARWIFYPDKMYVAPSLERKWSKKKIIRMYNESKNCQSTGVTYSERSLSNKRFEKIFSDIVDLIEQSQRKDR